MCGRAITASFWGKKLHSLTGIVPLGAFLFEHFYTNSFSIRGAAAYDQAAGRLRSLPNVVALEIGLIGLPLLYHSLYGTVITLEGRPNNLRYRYPRNWFYTLQRISGVLVAVYVILHVWETRIGTVRRAVPISFDYMAELLRDRLVVGTYAAGAALAVFHFANGLWAFCIGWGLTTSEQSMKRMAWFCTVLGVLLLSVALQGLFGFLEHA